MRSRSAVLDLGSNSFRLVVFDREDGWWRRTDEVHEAVRIGEGMDRTGELGEAPMQRALDVLDVFAHFLRASDIGPQDADAVATSAIREATNAEAFLARVVERTGLDVRVLSRREEAHYGYVAALGSTTLADGCVLDLGGGSMQLVGVADRLARDAESWKLGAVRMSERFLAGDGPASSRSMQELRDHVAAKLTRAPWLGSTGSRLVGVGGTVRTLAAASQRRAGLPTAGGIQGHLLGRDVLEELVAELAALPPAQRGRVAGIKPARADLVLAGAIVIATVMREGGFPTLEATEAGLREGVFFERLLRGRRPDGLPLVDDVRRASVENLAGQYPVGEAHVAHVARLALGLFDELARAGLHPGDPDERQLLWAAAMLHDVGMWVDYDDHHKHSRYLILNAGLPGFTPREVALIAQATRYHRKGMPDPADLEGLIGSRADRAVLDRLSVLLRLAEDLERSRDQLVGGVRVAVDDDRAQLELLSDAPGVAVPRWAVGRETELFSRAFSRRLVVA